MKNGLKVAAVQAGSCLFDTPRTLEKMARLCGELNGKAVDVVVFPEAFVGGYPKGLDFGARVGSRTPEGREDFLRYWQSAITVPGPEVEQIGAMARELRAHLITGVVEREGGTLYCSALFYAPTGELLAKHRKLMPTASERLIWGMGDGSTLPVIEHHGARIGAVICAENWMPTLRQAMYAKGVNIWCAPTIFDQDIWQSTMRHVAMEGRTFVVSASQFLLRSDAPADYACVQGNNPDTILMRGGSVIVGPMGNVIAGPVYDEEAILYADIDLTDVVRAQFDFDSVGHYARPDIFKLSVNIGPNKPVTFASDVGSGIVALAEIPKNALNAQDSSSAPKTVGAQQ